MEIRECRKHGAQKHFRRKPSGWRCGKCSSDQVSKRRRKVKAILVKEHGGKCVLCGYNRYVGALDFHHLDPLTKSFGLGNKGMTYALETMRSEADKCVLLCKNCHQEVEGGIVFLSGETGSRT